MAEVSLEELPITWRYAIREAVADFRSGNELLLPGMTLNAAAF